MHQAEVKIMMWKGTGRRVIWVTVDWKSVNTMIVIHAEYSSALYNNSCLISISYRTSLTIIRMATWLKLPVNDLTSLCVVVDGWDDRRLGHSAGRCT